MNDLEILSKSKDLKDKLDREIKVYTDSLLLVNLRLERLALNKKELEEKISCRKNKIYALELLVG